MQTSINLSHSQRKPRNSKETLINISLATLNEYFPQNAPIRVSRKWLESLGFSVDNPPKVVQIEAIKENEEEQKPLFQAEKL